MSEPSAHPDETPELPNEQLPEFLGNGKPEAPSWLFENIAEASKNTKRIFSIYIGVLAFGAVTIGAVTDRQIALNESAKLPFIGVSVPLTGFVLLFPIIALILFLVLQVYLYSLKGLVADLKTKYADVDDRRLYPWLVTIAEYAEPGIKGWIQRIVVGVPFWWSLPLVAMFNAVMIIRMHDPVLSYGLTGFALFINIFVALFWVLYTFVSVKVTIKRFPIYVHVLYMAIFGIGPFFLMSYIIPKAHSGWSQLADREGSWQYQYVRPLFILDLSYQKLISEPTIDYKGLYWGSLRAKHLEGADLTGAKLNRARLWRADLRHTILDSADLRHSYLKMARLDSANFFRASLVSAKLQNAKMRRVRLWGAQLQGADLHDADLRYSDLKGARLDSALFLDARLDSAEFIYTSLSGAKELTVAQLCEAKSLYKAKLDPVLFDSLMSDSTCQYLFDEQDTLK